MSALQEIGLQKAIRYAFGQVQIAWLKSELLLAPFRAFLLRLFGASLGKATVVHAVTFFNVYRSGFRTLTTGHHAFIGNECLLDLAGGIHLGDHATLAERVTILTHTNVGYADHPLQKYLPAMIAPVVIKAGAFVGVNATILPGVTIGEQAIVAAGALVREDVPDRTVVGGVPAHKIRMIDEA